MAEEGVEEQRAAPPEGAIGKLEPDSKNKEVNTGTVSFQILEVNGVLFTNRGSALEYAESLKDATTKV